MPPFPPLPLQNPPRSSALLLHHTANLPPLTQLPPPPCGFSASYPGHPTFHLCPLSTSLPPSQVCLCAASLTPAPSMLIRTTADPSPGTPPPSRQDTDPGSTNQSRLPEFLLQTPILVLHQTIYHDYILYCSWPWVLPCPFGSELLDCGVMFSTSLLSPMPQTKTPNSMLRGAGWTMLLHGHCPVVCHPSPSPGQDPIRQTSNGSEKIVELDQVRVICQGSPTVKTQSCPEVKETQFSLFPEHSVFGLELLNVCQMEKNWRSFGRGMTKGNSLESGIKRKENRVNLAGKRVDTNPR